LLPEEARDDKRSHVETEPQVLRSRTSYRPFPSPPVGHDNNPFLRHKDGIEACSEPEKMELQKITKKLCQCLNKDGRVLVNYAGVNGDPPFIRLILGNPELSSDQIESVIDIIESTGNAITSSSEHEGP